MLHKAIYLAGIRVRNRLIPHRHRSLLETDGLDRAALEAIQRERLAALVRHAVAHSAFHRRRFADAGIDPDAVRSIEDLAALPVTTKEELLAHNAEIQNTVPGEKAYYSETSGSSGSPLVFHRNQSWDAWHNASVFRGCGWHGVSPWERNGYLWGYDTARIASLKTRLLDALQNRFRLFSYSERDMSRFLTKLARARYLGGYSSMIHELAKHALAHPELVRGIDLKLIRATSEKIFESYQDPVERAFGRRMVSEYGAAESGIIAFECPEGHMHVNMETTLVETIDDEIIVTNLVSHSFPIIRYALGDYIELDDELVCGCGRHSPVIVSVTGRVGKRIEGREGRYPSLVLYYVFKNLATGHGIELNYQGVQRRKGHLEFRLERALDERERAALAAEIHKYFGDDMEIVVSESERLVTGDGKLKDFVSHL